jgi:hypothetical protein
MYSRLPNEGGSFQAHTTTRTITKNAIWNMTLAEDPEVRRRAFLRNFHEHLADYTVSHPCRLQTYYTQSPPLDPQIT